jgi:hypothetical protein
MEEKEQTKPLENELLEPVFEEKIESEKEHRFTSAQVRKDQILTLGNFVKMKGSFSKKLDKLFEYVRKMQREARKK